MFDKNFDELITEKLTILYTLNKIKKDMTDAQLANVILSTEILDYFTLMSLLQNMIETKIVTTYKKNGTILYSITQNGLEVLTSFIDRIPDYFIKKIDKYIDENYDEIFTERIMFKADYDKNYDFNYTVVASVTKGSSEIFKTSFLVENEDDAKRISSKWVKSGNEEYLKILNIFGLI
ncbi:DUF4364 family protein [Peptostreptococcus sp. D1]|uniref:DUF4364 family protein n=1 Tax=Peptostreptococcus sp. D1 TaxID=72304 RepID=UPI0008E5AC21|nr:DUF4364 family protein [Peptostreptococcus sp. D1]SFE71152.1 protein of unknown function [Peptostreptococcus sp. D1]